MQAPRNNDRSKPYRLQVTLALPALLLLCLATFGQVQAPQDPQQSSPDPAKAAPATAPQETKPGDKSTQPPAPPTTPLTPEQARQAQLVADTNKLLQLAEELKAEVAKSNKDTLSLSVIKKAAEVEKLAKSLKDRMKTQ